MSTIRFLSFLLFVVFAFSTWANPPVEIRINLEGYLSNMPKKALILSKGAMDNPILVLKNEKGEALKAYECQPHVESWHPFSHYYVADFSDLQKKGQYYFELRDIDIKSPMFTIGPYPRWQEDVVGFIRTQRCGFNPGSPGELEGTKGAQPL